MRQLIREKRGVWFAPFKSKEQVVTEDGMLTGEWRISYGKPQVIYPTVSPRSGNTWGDGFGIGVDCDRTMVIAELGTGIDETCVLWVDVRPKLDEDGEILYEDGEMVVPYDYLVTMVGESYNFTSVAMKKAGA